MMNVAATALEGKNDIPVTSGQPGSATETMNALVWHGKMDVRYEEVPKPKLVDPEDVLIKITATTICGSDLHCYLNEIKPIKEGQVMGHECMGVVESVAEGVKKLIVGDRVVVAFCISCGTCDHCKRREFTGCQKTNPSRLMQGLYGHCFAGILGLSELAGGYSGAQAEYVRVPFGDVNCLKISDSIPDEVALFLSDIVCTSYHAAIDLGQVQQGDNVAIWGAGPIGMLTAKWCDIFGAKWCDIFGAKWCDIFGARKIYVIENVEDRITLIKEKIPRVEIINFDHVDVNEELERRCPGGVDVAIECAGFRYAKSVLHKAERALMLETDTPELLNEAIKACRLFGRLSIIADYLGYTNHFNIGAMMEKHLYVAGGQCPCQAVWPKVLAYLEDGSFDPRICVTYYGKLSEGAQLYQKFNSKSDGIVKVFLRP